MVRTAKNALVGFAGVLLELRFTSELRQWLVNGHTSADQLPGLLQLGAVPVVTLAQVLHMGQHQLHRTAHFSLLTYTETQNVLFNMGFMDTQQC